MSSMKPAPSGGPYRIPPEPSGISSLLLALLVHAGLLAFLWIGVRWQTENPVTVEAEVWDMSVQTAAAPELPAPEPEPEPEPEPAPEPAPEPPPAPPAPVIEQPAPTPPDIALKMEKQRREEQRKKELAEQRERERLEQKERELAEQKKREEAQRKEKELAAKKEADAKKEAEAKKKEEQRLAAEKKKEEQRLAAEKKKKAEAAAKAEAAKLEKFRQEELKRMAGAMGTGGTAAKSTAPKVSNDAYYKNAITAAIKSNTAFAGNTAVPGNPTAEFHVEQLPTGEIMSVRLKKSSGVPEFDRAVENGIKKASPLPKRKDGTVERSLDIRFSMKDYD